MRSHSIVRLEGVCAHFPLRDLVVVVDVFVVDFAGEDGSDSEKSLGCPRVATIVIVVNNSGFEGITEYCDSSNCARYACRYEIKAIVRVFSRRENGWRSRVCCKEFHTRRSHVAREPTSLAFVGSGWLFCCLGRGLHSGRWVIQRHNQSATHCQTTKHTRPDQSSPVPATAAICFTRHCPLAWIFLSNCPPISDDNLSL